jgi:cytochrome c peroxidase
MKPAVAVFRSAPSWLGDDAFRGAALFFGKANCVACHTGPALNTMAFRAIGMGDLEGTGVTGYDPTKPEHLGRGGFTGIADDNFKFKVPQLYNLTDSPFLGHGGMFTSLREILDYKTPPACSGSTCPQANDLDWRVVGMR